MTGLEVARLEMFGEREGVGGRVDIVYATLRLARGLWTVEDGR